MSTNLGDLLRKAGIVEDDLPPEPTPEPARPSPRGKSKKAKKKKKAASPEPRGDGGLPDKVVVRRTKKGRGGKTVTLVQGIGAGRNALAKTLRKQMGVGSRVEGDDIVFQGDQVDRLAAWFEAQGVKKVSRGR